MPKMKRILAGVLSAGLVLSAFSPAFAATENYISKTATVKSGNKVYQTQTKIERYTKQGDLAADEALISEELGVKTVEKLTVGDAPIVRIDNRFGDVKKGDSFDLVLSEDSEWSVSPQAYVEIMGKYDPKLKVSAVKVSWNRVSVTVDTDIPKDAMISIPVEATASGKSEIQTVSVEPRSSGVSGKVMNFAKTGENDITIKVDKMGKFTRGGENTVTIVISEFDSASFKNSDELTFTLPEYFTWKSVDGDKGKINRYGEVLTLDLSKFDTKTTDTLYLRAKINVDRDASFGDVYAKVKSKNYSEGSLNIGKYVDSDVTVSVEKVVDVLSGKDQPGLYKARVILEENAAGALRSGRTIYFDFNGKYFSLQDSETLRVIKRRGDGQVLIDARSSYAFDDRTDSESVLIKTDRRYDNVDASYFELEVKESSNRESKYEVEIPFVVAEGYQGDIIAKVSGAGIKDQEIKIANAYHPFDVSVKDNNLIIKEKESGAFIPERNSRNDRYNEVVYKIKPKQGTLQSADIRVTDGDLELNRKSEVRNGEIQIIVDKKSRKKSEVTISNIKSYGISEFEMYGGNASERHFFKETKPYVFKYSGKDSGSAMSNSVMVSMFTIGSTGYSRYQDGKSNYVSMGVAPFIKDSRTMLPVRYVAEALGAGVSYNDLTREATFRTDNTVVTIPIDKNYMYVNGSKVYLYTKPSIVKGRIYIPIASVAMAFNAHSNIIWDNQTKTATVISLNASENDKVAVKSGRFFQK